MVPKTLKEGLGKAFVFGYGTSKGLPEKALEVTGQISKAKEGIVKSNIERLGTGTLSKGQQEELVSKMLEGKRAEFAGRTLSKDIAQSADWFEPLKKRATSLIENREKDILQLSKEINKLSKKGLSLSLKSQKNAALPKLVSKVQVKTTPTIETVRFGADDTLLEKTIKPGTTKASDVGFAIPTSSETKQFVESLVKAPRSEVERVKKLIGTREGWQRNLFAKIDDLNKEYIRLNELQRDTFKLADTTRVKGRDAALETVKSTDPAVQKAIETQIPRTQKFAKGAGVDDPFTVYFPGIAKDKIQKLVENPSFIKVSKEGYKKEFKNLLKDEELVRDPAEAYARREFDIAKDNIVRTQLKGVVKEFGKPTNAFKSADEALKAGYVPIKEKGAFGNVVGYVTKNDKQFLDNLISPEFTTIDRLAKATGYDAVTSLFKRSVTGLFAPFHVRNYASGIMQNYEVLGAQALSPKNLALGQRISLALSRSKKFGAETLKVGNKTYKLDSIIEPFAKRFETSSQYISDIGEAVKGGEKMIPKKLSNINPFSENFTPFKAARAVGNYIETQQKATAYITALRQGKSIKEALELATNAGFDYRAITPFESKVLRRIIPFYTFTRKNLELQLRTLGKNPERINNILKTGRTLESDLSAEEKAKLPDYTKEQFALKTGTTKGGLPEIATGFGTPIEQFSQFLTGNPIRKIAASLNPILKLPLERTFNKDFFRNRPLDEVIEAGEYARAPKWIKDFLKVKAVERKNKDGTTRTVYNANPNRLQLLRNLPTTRGATYLSAIYDPSATSISKYLNALTGVKPKPIDIDTVEYYRDKDNRTDLENLLIQAGVLKRFETTYKPKN